MVILAGDNDWSSRLAAVFEQRVQFELQNLDKLNLSGPELFQLVSGWSLKWNYTPKMTSATSLTFRPGELPPEPELMSNQPKPGGRALAP